MKRHSKHLVPGNDIAPLQLVVQHSRTEALVLSQRPIPQDRLLDIKHLPESFLRAIDEAGLSERYKSMPKMLIAFNERFDPVKSVLHFVRAYGVIPVRYGEVMRPLTIKK